MLEWKKEAIDAAQAAVAAVNTAVDSIILKAVHLESLLVLLAHTSALEDLPSRHRENVSWLGSELAAEIRAAAGVLSAQPGQ